MIQFKSEDKFFINGRGMGYVVALDQDTNDFKHLLGQHVLIDGVKYQCVGVERNAKMPPFKAGEKISLLVAEGRLANSVIDAEVVTKVPVKEIEGAV